MVYTFVCPLISTPFRKWIQFLYSFELSDFRMIESRNWKIENYHHTSIFMCLSTLTFPYHYINHELIRYDWVSLIFHGRCFNTTQIQDFYNSFETVFNVYRPALCWNRNIPCKLYQWYGYWCSGLLRRQVISSHGIDHINGRHHFVYGPTNERRRYYVTSSHWLGAYTKWSLNGSLPSPRKDFK